MFTSREIILPHRANLVNDNVLIIHEIYGNQGTEMTSDQLPAIIRSGALAASDDIHLVPALIADAGDKAAWRYLEFFIANIRNANTWRKGWLFRTSPGHNAMMLADTSMSQADAWRMIRRRAAAAGIHAPIGNHTFRATGITAYLGNGGALEHAQTMAAHESPRRTKLYDRTKDRFKQDEVERIRI
jgi:integrase